MKKYVGKITENKLYYGLFGLCILIGSILVGIYIFWGYEIFFHSDTAVANVLAREELNTGQFFPSTWCYIQDIWIFTPHWPILLFSSITKDQMILHGLSISVYTIFLTVTIIFFFKKVFNDIKSLIMFLAIIFSGISANYLENMFGQGCYLDIMILTLSMLMFGVCSTDNDFKINKKNCIGLIIVLLLALPCGTRYYLTFLIPFVGAMLVTYILEKYNNTWDQIKYNLINILRYLIIIGVVSVIGYLLFTYISSKVEFSSGVANPEIYSAFNIKMFTNNAVNFIVGIFYLSGYTKYTGIKLTSSSGMVAVGKAMFGIIIVFVIPMLLTKKWKDHSIAIKRLLAFHWVLSSIVIVTMLFTDNGINVEQIRYYLVNYNLALMFCSYYVVKYLLNKPIMIKFLSLFAVITFIILSWYCTRDTFYNYSSKIQSKNNLIQFMEENDLDYGYASYWNATENMVRSDFNIQIGTIDLNDMEPYLKLSSDSYINNSYKGNTFIMLTKDEYKSLNTNLKFKLLYTDYSEILEFNDYRFIRYNYNIADKFIFNNLDSEYNLIPYMAATSTNVSINSDVIEIGTGGSFVGPNINLKAGKYQVHINYTGNSEDSIVLKATSNFGICAIGQYPIVSGDNIVEINLDETYSTVQFTIRNTTAEDINLSSITLMKMEE